MWDFCRCPEALELLGRGPRPLEVRAVRYGAIKFRPRLGEVLLCPLAVLRIGRGLEGDLIVTLELDERRLLLRGRGRFFGRSALGAALQGLHALLRVSRPHGHLFRTQARSGLPVRLSGLRERGLVRLHRHTQVVRDRRGVVPFRDDGGLGDRGLEVLLQPRT